MNNTLKQANHKECKEAEYNKCAAKLKKALATDFDVKDLYSALNATYIDYSFALIENPGLITKDSPGQLYLLTELMEIFDNDTE